MRNKCFAEGQATKRLRICDNDSDKLKCIFNEILDNILSQIKNK